MCSSFHHNAPVVHLYGPDWALLAVQAPEGNQYLPALDTDKDPAASATDADSGAADKCVPSIPISFNVFNTASFIGSRYIVKTHTNVNSTANIKTKPQTLVKARFFIFHLRCRLVHHITKI